MKQYRLLKDLPITLAGTIFYPKEENSSVYKPKNGGWLEEVPEELVTGCPHFFEEVNTVEKGYQDLIEKCKNSPYFFATNYLTINGKPFSTMLSEEEFNKQFLSLSNPEPSSKKEEGWEILEGKSSNGKVHQYLKDNSHGGLSCKEIGCEIFSVLRKSDNTVFTVGDETTIGVIKRFEVSEELMYWWNEHTWYYLSQAIKAPTNTVEDSPFVWTDELVEDYSTKKALDFSFNTPTEARTNIERFKKSKTSNQ